MLRVICLLLAESSNKIILQQLHFYFTIFFLSGCFYIKFLAEWIAIKRPNSSRKFTKITILLLVGFFGYDLSTLSGKWIAFQCSFHGIKILW
jgi:hypothetical protein